MVGWQFSPTITLHFAQTYAFGTLRLLLQDAQGAAGIYLPLSVDISQPVGGPVNYPLSAGTVNKANWYNFDVSGLSGNMLQFTLNRTGTWLFLGEVEVLDSQVPEPGTFAVVGIAAIAGLTVLRRHRS